MIIEVFSMETKNKHVAIAYDEHGKCILVCKCKTISEQELNKLLNEEEQNKKQAKLKEYHLGQTIQRHDFNFQHLYARDYILAKALYDRFVDRGYIDENKEFDKAFYELIFEDKEISEELVPNEFKTILSKVGNL